MAGCQQGMTFKIAGLLFAIAGLVSAIAGRVAIGMMDVAIGMMFVALGVSTTRRSRDADRTKSNPPIDNSKVQD
jgi:hypothetical protein